MRRAGGEVLINRKTPNTPTAIGELIGDLRALDVGVTVGVDMPGKGRWLRRPVGGNRQL